MSDSSKYDQNLPQFNSIDIVNFPEQLNKNLSENKEKITALLKNNTNYNWQNLMRPLEDIDDKLSRLWSPISHMHSVVDSDILRKTYQTCLPILSQYNTEIGQHSGLYEAIKSIQDNEDKQNLSQAQRKIIKNYIRDFGLSGVALSKEKKKLFLEKKKRLSQLTSQFEENVLDATQSWSKHITAENLVRGLPEYALANAKKVAEQKQLSGWLFTLDFPNYYAVITYAENDKLREEIYHAYVTRASEQGDGSSKWDNSAIMNGILTLRHELAHILDFNNYAEYSLATKMAEAPKEVLDFLQDLARRSKKQAAGELQQLSQFAQEEFQIEQLKPWDVSFYSEKLRQHQFSLSQEDLRPYFPEDTVIKGMFAIIQQLYGVNLCERTGVETWHEDVRFFDVFDENDEICGQLYMDLYARPQKRSGAWMDECITRRRLSDKQVQIPVAYLNCNFGKGSGDKPTLLSHDEVLTLFHECGHCLHHLLTKIDFADVSGIHGVPWDAVELPSQFFENWCWQRQSLDLISGHYQTKEKLPEALYQKLLASRHFLSAMQMVRQLEFALFDFNIHYKYDEKNLNFIQEILDQVRQAVAVVPIADYNRFQHSFSHIFAGGYAAGYYSYKWAEVLSSDAFSKFEEEGVFNPAIGRQFLHNILEQGGSKEPAELFLAFRGRSPQIDALLRHNGINS